jgi:hypothetical protein
MFCGNEMNGVGSVCEAVAAELKMSHGECAGRSTNLLSRVALLHRGVESRVEVLRKGKVAGVHARLGHVLRHFFHERLERSHASLARLGWG